MFKKKMLFTSLMGILVVGSLVGCNGNNGSQSGSNSGSSSLEPITSNDPIAAIPEEVLNYSGDIDALVYIEGQVGIVNDIGNPNIKVTTLMDNYLARFAAAAREFRKIAPNVKINVRYCSINEYNDQIISYKESTGHLPHIMHGVEHVNEMISLGYSTDLSVYKDSEWYQAFDQSIMNEFNFGGFQGAVPYMVYPMGIFANTSILEKEYFYDTEDLLKDWTVEKLFDVMAEVTNSSHAGVASIHQDVLSYAIPSINLQYRDTGTVSLNTQEVKDLLEIEQTFPQYSVYNYPMAGGADAKESYEGSARWYTVGNFVQDEYHVFNMEMPWNIGYVSQVAEVAGKADKFDYFPWPASKEYDGVSGATGPVIGMIAEGLTIGNQCPIDFEGNPQCGEKGQIETDVAAYFTMFMNSDPRAITAKANIEWFNSTIANADGTTGAIIKGIMDLPMVKKNYKFTFQDDAEEDAFTTQLTQWFQCYKTYWNAEDENSVPDVENYSNVKPGMKMVLELFYADNPTNRVNFYGIPDNIPNGASGTIDIMGKWTSRQSGDGTITIADSGWTSWVTSNLQTWEDEINANTTTAFELLQENMDTYYGAGKYDVFAD